MQLEAAGGRPRIHSGGRAGEAPGASKEQVPVWGVFVHHSACRLAPPAARAQGAGGCPLYPSSDLDCGAPVSATERLSSWLQCEESEQRSQTKADKTAGEHSPQPGPRGPGLPSQWGAHQALGIALWAVGRLPQQWAWEWGTWGRCWRVALQLALWSWEVWGWRAGRQDGSHLFPRIRELTSRLSPTPTSHPWNLS